MRHTACRRVLAMLVAALLLPAAFSIPAAAGAASPGTTGSLPKAQAEPVEGSAANAVFPETNTYLQQDLYTATASPGTTGSSCYTPEELAELVELVADPSVDTIYLKKDLYLEEYLYLTAASATLIEAGSYSITVAERGNLSLEGPITLHGENGTVPLVSLKGGGLQLDGGACIEAVGDGSTAVYAGSSDSGWGSSLIMWQGTHIGVSGEDSVALWFGPAVEGSAHYLTAQNNTGGVSAVGDGSTGIRADGSVDSYWIWRFPVMAEGVGAVALRAYGDANFFGLDLTAKGSGSVGAVADGTLNLILCRINAEGEAARGELVRLCNSEAFPASSLLREVPARVIIYESLAAQAGQVFVPPELDMVFLLWRDDGYVFSYLIPSRVLWDDAKTVFPEPGDHSVGGILLDPEDDETPLDLVGPFTAPVVVGDGSAPLIWLAELGINWDFIPEVNLYFYTDFPGYIPPESVSLWLWNSSEERWEQLEASWNGESAAFLLERLPAEHWGYYVAIHAAGGTPDGWSNIFFLDVDAIFRRTRNGGDRLGIDRSGASGYPSEPLPHIEAEAEPAPPGNVGAAPDPENESGTPEGNSTPEVPAPAASSGRRGSVSGTGRTTVPAAALAVPSNPVYPREDEGAPKVPPDNAVMKESPPLLEPARKETQASGESEYAPGYSARQLMDLIAANPRQVTFIQNGIKVVLPTEVLRGLLLEEGTRFITQFERISQNEFYINFFLGDSPFTLPEGVVMQVGVPLKTEYPLEQIACIGESGRSYPASAMENGRIIFDLTETGDFVLSFAAVLPDAQPLPESTDAKPPPDFPGANQPLAAAICGGVTAAGILKLRRKRNDRCG